MPITPHNPFKGRQYPGEVIILYVRWYLRYPLSYEHGRGQISVSRSVPLGQTIDFLLTAKRDTAAAKRFLPLCVAVARPFMQQNVLYHTLVHKGSRMFVEVAQT